MSVLLLTLLAGCGLTEPENRLLVRGTVVAAGDGEGVVEGAPVPDATVELRYSPPLDFGSVLKDQVVTAADGSWEVETGPPGGQSQPNCRTLSVSVAKGGFVSATVSLASFCEGAGVVNDVRIELAPGG